MRIALFSIFALAGCQKAPDINVFTVTDDMTLGAQLKEEIASDPDTYPILDPVLYPEAYDDIDRVRDEILASDAIRYRNTFDWQVQIIDDDETLNAFAAPGGYIWVYTGLIRFLTEEDQLAGVLAHEMAHADRRHATQQLTKVYGISVLLDALVGKKGDPRLIADIAAQLAELSFSRAQEAEADEYSVVYLCDSQYAANGAAGFFEMMQGSPEPPVFLSDHPSSASRIQDIDAKAEELGCSTEPSGHDYQGVIDDLPPPMIPAVTSR
jgi:predicted Zn-dependent protease